MSIHQKTALIIAFFILALGLAGTDDYMHAVCAAKPSDCEVEK